MMTAASQRLSRRVFLADVGRGMVAIALLGVVGCARVGAARPPRPRSRSDEPSAAARPRSGSAEPGAPAWHRVDVGFVSAYVLAREGEAAVVDTAGPIGTDAGSSEADILVALEAAGLGWPNVAHVILTHWHSDHAGSAAAVLEAAPDAQGYAGAEDIPHIVVPRPLVPVIDGDDVFGLRIVATPGHTPGHIAVLDEALGVLVVGDAMTTNDGRPTSPPVRTTGDMEQALRTVAKIGALDFETLLVGHGDPIESGAAVLVREFLDACPPEGDQGAPVGAACRHPMDMPPGMPL